jgi:hypothetical protein
MRTSNGDFCLCGVDELAWWFVTWGNITVSGGGDAGEVQILILQGENLRFGLN